MAQPPCLQPSFKPRWQEGTRPARTGPLDAFKLARRTWQDGERVDMSALARELGVNRVTLYRWVGSREQLLVEVIWSLAERTLSNLDSTTCDRRRARGQGRERVHRRGDHEPE